MGRGILGEHIQSGWSNLGRGSATRGETGCTGLKCGEPKARREGRMRVWGGRWGPGAEGRGLSRLSGVGAPGPTCGGLGPAPCPAELLRSAHGDRPQLGASRPTGLPALSPPLPQSAARPARGCSLLSRTGGSPHPRPGCGTPHKGGRGQATVPAGGSTCRGLCRPCLARPWDPARKPAQGLSPGPGGDAILGSDASSPRAQLCDLGQVTSPL